MTLLLVAALVGIFFYGRTSPPPLPNPNGYDDLTKAGQAVSLNLDGLADRDLDGLRVLVTKYVMTLTRHYCCAELLPKTPAL